MIHTSLDLCTWMEIDRDFYTRLWNTNVSYYSKSKNVILRSVRERYELVGPKKRIGQEMSVILILLMKMRRILPKK